MQIISHRGFWIEPAEKNSRKAFERTIEQGYGTETDIRDHNGELVISHNMPLPEEELMLFDDFMALFLSGPYGSLPLAINIKSDGLQDKVEEVLKKYNFSSYFVFDMSIPDTIGYLKKGLKFFSRVSEYEPEPVFYEATTGIWVDIFTGIWFKPELIEKYLGDGKQVCFVSPDLHQRDSEPLWKLLQDQIWYRNENVILCTDFPDKATKYFNL